MIIGTASDGISSGNNSRGNQIKTCNRAPVKMTWRRVGVLWLNLAENNWEMNETNGGNDTSSPIWVVLALKNRANAEK